MRCLALGCGFRPRRCPSVRARTLPGGRNPSFVICPLLQNFLGNLSSNSPARQTAAVILHAPRRHRRHGGRAGAPVRVLAEWLANRGSAGGGEQLDVGESDAGAWRSVTAAEAPRAGPAHHRSRCCGCPRTTPRVAACRTITLVSVPQYEHSQDQDNLVEYLDDFEEF
ncbi:hypothetical protein SEVIR_2G204750v4 [Setaria viridis]